MSFPPLPFETNRQFSFEDEHTVRERFWKIGPGDWVLDIGAEAGAYTLWALHCGAERVYSFDPHEPDARMLEDNLKLNPGFAERCFVKRLAVGETEGLFDGASSARSEGGNTPIVVLDKWAADLPRCDWIKLDVEGHEAAALRGAQELIRRCHPKMLVECHQFMDATLLDQVVDAVRRSGVGYDITAEPYANNSQITHALFLPKEKP